MTSTSPATHPWLYETYCYMDNGVLCWGTRLRPEHRRPAR